MDRSLNRAWRESEVGWGRVGLGVRESLQKDSPRGPWPRLGGRLGGVRPGSPRQGAGLLPGNTGESPPVGRRRCRCGGGGAGAVGAGRGGAALRPGWEEAGAPLAMAAAVLV